MSILYLIASQNFIAVNKELIKIFGLEEAIILGELASEYNYWEKLKQLDDEGYFFSTVENIEENTTIKEKRQRNALNNLKARGIIDVKLKGLPAKRYIKINEEQLTPILLNSNSQNDGDSSAKMAELERPQKPSNKNISNNNKSTTRKKKESKSKANSFDSLIDKYSNGNEEVKTLLGDWLKVRKAKRAAMTDRAIELNLQKLDRLATESNLTVAEYLKEVICRGWQAFYPINNFNALAQKQGGIMDDFNRMNEKIISGGLF